MGRKKGVSYKGFTPEQYFWANVDKNGPIPIDKPELGSCWNWTGNISPAGYGRYCFEGEIRFAYEIGRKIQIGENLDYEPLAKGIEHDHVCRNRQCVRESHIEIVTQTVNTLRGTSPPAQNAQKTHCSVCGFELSERMDRGRIHRYCKACNLTRAHKNYHEKVKPAQDQYRQENNIDVSNLPQFNALKTLCKRGHPLDGIQKKTGRRYCITCNREASNEKYRRLKESLHKK